jgi:hypothetical protein
MFFNAQNRVASTRQITTKPPQSHHQLPRIFEQNFRTPLKNTSKTPVFSAPPVSKKIHLSQI